RYATAHELAADLRRFLADRPVQARRPSPRERLTRWARRHQGTVVSLFSILIVTVVALSASTLLIARQEKRVARESLIQQPLLLRMAPHEHGWSGKAWDLVRQAAPLGRDEDGTVQVQAIAALGGLDARPARRFTQFGAGALAFDREGRRLLMGATADPR